jgi:hypothetical protein
MAAWNSTRTILGTCRAEVFGTETVLFGQGVRPIPVKHHPEHDLGLVRLRYRGRTMDMPKLQRTFTGGQGAKGTVVA